MPYILERREYKAAGKFLMERMPTLFWTACVARCLDLILEDIGKLKEFKKTIACARHLTTFVYRHQRLLDAIREKTCGVDLVTPAITRFATSFLTLQSLHKHKYTLKDLFICDDWTKTKLADTKAGEKVYATVFSSEFWDLVEDCVRASQPLLSVLRMVYSYENPAMPKVATFMAQAKEKIKASFSTENKSALLKSIMTIIDQRWVNQMDTPLYGAALYLNPGKFFHIQKNDDAYVGKLRGCFLDVLARLVEDVDLQFKIDSQALLYEDQSEEVFSNKMAIRNIQSRSPIHWWHAYGGQVIELQRLAKRVVSLCASSRGCEQNWSIFESIHIKKMNRLEQNKLNDLVYVSYNLKMVSRLQKRREGGKSYEPLAIEEIDWDNEWVNPFAEPPQGSRGCHCDCDLTWDHVDEIVGASQRVRFTPKVVEEGAPHRDSSNEDEEEIVLDDNDVDDYGEAPMDAHKLLDDLEMAYLES